MCVGTCCPVLPQARLEATQAAGRAGCRHQAVSRRSTGADRGLQPVAAVKAMSIGKGQQCCSRRRRSRRGCAHVCCKGMCRRNFGFLPFGGAVCQQFLFPHLYLVGFEGLLRTVFTILCVFTLGCGAFLCVDTFGAGFHASPVWFYPGGGVLLLCFFCFYIFL